MGPHFDRASRRVGRRRLPHGYVAVLDDPPHLTDVIGELHAYAATTAADPPQLGVVFGAVTAADRAGIGHHLMAAFGPAAYLEQAARYGVDDGYHYVIDTQAIAHVWGRHGDPLPVPRRRPQVAITLADLCRLPQAINVRNIIGFEERYGKHRIVYRDTSATDPLLVVMEIQRAHQWVVLRTMYNPE